MESNERIIAITRLLPSLEAFLREVLANENLSAEAEKQRLDFVKELEPLTKPPSLPPRPSNLKSQSRASVDSIDSVETDDNDFASVQRKLSNIFYLRRDFDELNDHFVNGFAGEESSKGTTRKGMFRMDFSRKCLKTFREYSNINCVLVNRRMQNKQTRFYPLTVFEATILKPLGKAD